MITESIEWRNYKLGGLCEFPMGYEPGDGWVKVGRVIRCPISSQSKVCPGFAVFGPDGELTAVNISVPKVVNDVERHRAMDWNILLKAGYKLVQCVVTTIEEGD